MSITFNKSYIKEAIIAKSGNGIKSIEIPFVPNYVRVKFEGPQTATRCGLLGNDKVFWDLVKLPTGNYRLDISWSLYSVRREIRAQVAILQVDPV
jgi:hypothetical protein